MSVTKVKVLFWLAIAIAGLTFLHAAFRGFADDASRARSAGAVILLVAGVAWYWRSRPVAEARDAERRQAQLEALRLQMSVGEPVTVKASSDILILIPLVCVALGIGLDLLSEPERGAIVVLGMILPFILYYAWIAIPLLGKPALHIRPEGIETPTYGLMRWEEIGSIGLRPHEGRWRTWYSLDLFVPNLCDRMDQMHPFMRGARRAFPFAGRNFVTIRLKSPSVPAQTVHSLAYESWRRSTGRFWNWTRTSTAWDMEQALRGDESFAMMRHIVVALQHDNRDEAARLMEQLKYKNPTLHSRMMLRSAQQSVPLSTTLITELNANDPRNAQTRAARDKSVRSHRHRNRWIMIALVAAAMLVLMVVIVVK